MYIMTGSENFGMNSQLAMMNASILGEYYTILESVGNLPPEIIRKILYEFKGFTTPSQEIITNLFDNIYIRNSLNKIYNNYLDDMENIMVTRTVEESYSHTMGIPWVCYKDSIHRSKGFTYQDITDFYSYRLFVRTDKFKYWNPMNISRLFHKTKKQGRNILDYNYYFNRFNDDNIQETNNIIEYKVRHFRDDLGYEWSEGESYNMFVFVRILKQIISPTYPFDKNPFSKKELLDRYYSAKGDYTNPETGRTIKRLKKEDISKLIVKYYFKW